MQGWIKLHREIIEHWVYSNDQYYKAWTTLVLLVNHTKKKVLIKGTLFDCDRAESLMSLDNWAEKFGKNWDKSKVRRFFKLLEGDNMIVLKNERKTTRVKVCNYETYQGERNTDETQMKRERNTDETRTTPNKNDKELIKNENNKKNIVEIYKNYPSKCPVKNRATSKSSKNKDKIERLLKTISKDDMIKIQNGYVIDCVKNQVSIKNYSTFLNNFPDPEQFETENQSSYEYNPNG